MSSVEKKISESAAAFHDKLWPLISETLGGGRIVHVESVSEQDFFKQVLDAYGGIDTWHVDDERHLIRGLASRMQRTKRVFQTITIRYKRQTGNDTEIHKRMKALQEPGKWLHPSVVIQGYFEPDGKGYGEPKAAAVANMVDVIRIIADGKQGDSFKNPCDWYLEKTSPKYGNHDNTEFAVVPLRTLEKYKCKHRWLKFIP